jgi:putative SOS response-associated peptidase YedK
MCGRYYRTEDKQAIAEFFHAEPTGDELLYAPGYNIAPTTIQPVIRQNRDTLTPEAVLMRWGMVGYHSTGPDPKRASFNARAESLEKSGLWRGPFHRHRCLIPASGFFEWFKPTKEAWRFTLKDDPKLIAFAGVWDAWKNPANSQWLQSYAIITVSANSVLAPIHDRMPAILQPKDYERWLDREEIERPPEDLLRPFEATRMLKYHAHPKVGNVRNQGPDMLNN